MKKLATVTLIATLLEPPAACLAAFALLGEQVEARPASSGGAGRQIIFLRDGISHRVTKRLTKADHADHR